MRQAAALASARGLYNVARVLCEMVKEMSDE